MMSPPRLQLPKPDKLQKMEYVQKNLVAEEGDVLTLQNFLRIEKYKSPATNRRNPQTGETIAVPEKVRTKAKANF